MKRGLLLLALVAALTGAAAGGLWYALAAGMLTGPLSRWTGDQLGRALVADGNLSIRIGRTTRIMAGGLRLANVPWGARPDMLVARSVVIELDTGSLLDDTIIVRQVRAEGVELLLEQAADGSNNWTFDLSRDERPARSAVPLVIRRLSLPGARVRLASPRLERPLDVMLESAEQSESVDGMLHLAARGNANDTPLDLRLQAGPVAGLLAGRDVRFRAEGSIGEVALDADARVDMLDQPADTEARLALRGPDAAYLAGHLGVRNLGDGPFALEAVISPAPAGSGLRGRVSGVLGKFDVVARGYLDPRAEPATVGVQARVAGPDLALAGAIAGIRRLPAEPFRLRLDVRRRGAVLHLADGELQLGAARATASGSLGSAAAGAKALEFRVEGADLARIGRWTGIAGLPPGEVVVTGAVSRPATGDLTLRVSGTTPLGAVAARGSLGPAPGFFGTRLRIEARGADFRPLGVLLGWAQAPGGAFRAQGRLAWSDTGVALDGVRLAIDADELRLDGSIARAPQAVGTDLRFALTGPDPGPLGARLGVDGLPAGAYRVAGRLRRQQSTTALDKVEAALAGATLQLSGTLGDAPAFKGTRLAFDVQGPALERFQGLLGDYELPRGAFRAAGALERSGARIRLREVQASAGGATATASAAFNLPLQAATVTFDIDARGPDLARLLPALGEAAQAGKDFELQARGAHAPGRWSVERLRLKTGAGFLDLAGEFALAPRFSATSLSLEARAASLRDAGHLFGREWPDQPLALGLRLTGTGTDFDLEQVTGRLGASDFKGRMAVRTRDGLRDLDIDLESTQLDLRPWWRNPARQPAPATARRGDKSLLIPVRQLTLAALDGYTGKLALRARQLLLGDGRFDDLELRGKLSPRRLRIDPLRFGGADGEVTASIELDDEPGGLAVRVAGTGSNLALAPVPTGPRGPDASRYEVEFDLTGRGRDLRELAGTLGGRVRLVGRGGRIANSRLMAASDDFLTKLLSSLNPMTERQPATNVACVAYLLQAKDGVVTTDPALVMQTTELDIISHGSVDLRTEKIDFNFKTAARKGLGLGITQLVNPFVKVTGTLAAPGITLDPRGAVVTGGAAFATAGLSIVATTAWDRVFSASDPCGAALAESESRAGAGPAESSRWRKLLPVP